MKWNSILFCFLATTALAAPAFDKDFEAYNRKGGPGFAAMVIKDGKVIYQKGFGLASVKAATRITPSTNFNLASNSKQFTAMAILLLEQAKKLSPDDPLSKFIPEIPDYMKPIRIRHLLYHTSGLPDYMEVCSEKAKVYNADILNALRKKDKLLFPPGSRYEYSNSGYVLLSEVVQRAAGKPFPDFIQDEIFQKLGMKNSLVMSDKNEAKLARRALGYKEWPYLTENDASPCNYNFGDGGIYTSLEDYYRWATFIEHPQVLLKPEFQKKFLESGKTNSDESTAYAYGWRTTDYNGQKMIQHSGAWLGSRSYVGFIPEKHLWVVILSNYEGISLDPAVFLAEFAK